MVVCSGDLAQGGQCRVVGDHQRYPGSFVPCTVSVCLSVCLSVFLFVHVSLHVCMFAVCLNVLMMSQGC